MKVREEERGGASGELNYSHNSENIFSGIIHGRWFRLPQRRFLVCRRCVIDTGLLHSLSDTLGNIYATFLLQNSNNEYLLGITWVYKVYH